MTIFFRKANTLDLLELNTLNWTIALENSYLIEDEQEIIGCCSVKDGHISFFMVKDKKHTKHFIEMIEEFFFMKESVLTTNLEEFLAYGWQKKDGIICKHKKPSNPYEMGVSDND